MIYTEEETISSLDIFQLYFDNEDLRLRDIMMRDRTGGAGQYQCGTRDGTLKEKGSGMGQESEGHGTRRDDQKLSREALLVNLLIVSMKFIFFYQKYSQNK